MSDPLRYLVADDERHVARMIQVLLERRGFLVTCAFDGRQALELLKAEPFDRVVLDLMMPYVDGYEILRWIREKETSHTWVALMPAQAEAIEADHRFKYRADIYVTKPFNPDLLIF